MFTMFQIWLLLTVAAGLALVTLVALQGVLGSLRRTVERWRSSATARPPVVAARQL